MQLSQYSTPGKLILMPRITLLRGSGGEVQKRSDLFLTVPSARDNATVGGILFALSVLFFATLNTLSD